MLKMHITQLNKTQINAYHTALERIIIQKPDEDLGKDWYLRIECEMFNQYESNKNNVRIGYDLDILKDICRLFSKTYTGFRFHNFDDIIKFINLM